MSNTLPPNSGELFKPGETMCNSLLSQRIVNEWNSLSVDCVGASSVNMFKIKIDIYLRRAG